MRPTESCRPPRPTRASAISPHHLGQIAALTPRCHLGGTKCSSRRSVRARQPRCRRAAARMCRPALYIAPCGTPHTTPTDRGISINLLLAARAMRHVPTAYVCICMLLHNSQSTKGSGSVFGIKTGIFGRPTTKVHLRWAWRIEFSYRNIRD
jgi:hypothetical protein